MLGLRLNFKIPLEAQLNSLLFSNVKGYLILDVNTPGTRGGPGGRNRTLAVKRRKNAKKSVFFFVKK